MRKILYLLLCLTCSVLARAQSSVIYRYWFDQNEAEARTQIAGRIADLRLDAGTLTKGLHEVHIQLLDKNGIPTPAENCFFYSANREPVKSVVAYVVYIDGNEHTILQQSNSNLLLNLSDLTSGFHHLQVAAVTSGGELSQIEDAWFLRVDSSADTQFNVAIYVDGKQHSQQLAELQSGVLTCNIDVNDIGPGIHNMQAVVVGKNGTASQIAESWFVRKANATDITKMKCYYSIDGGQAVLQEGAYSNGGFKLDIDTSDLTDGIHKIMCFLMDEHGVTTDVQTNFFAKKHLGGNGVEAYSYWVNDDIANISHQTLDEKQNPYNLISLIPVQTYPLRSSNFHFEYKGGTPYIFAKNDFHVLFTDASNQTSTNNASYIDYKTSREVTDATAMQPKQTLTVNNPGENGIKWFTVEAQTGDSLIFKTTKACTIQLFAPNGNEVYSANGAEAVNWGGCHARQDGTYYLALHDVTAKNVSTLKVSYDKIGKYVVLSHTPNTFGAKPGSKFYIDLFGNGYDKLTSVRLTRGETTLTTQEIEVTDISHASLKFLLPTADIPLGKYDMLLDFEDGGSTSTLSVANAITMAEPVEGEIRIAIKSYKRTAKPYPVYITATNTGNIIKENVVLRLAFDNIGNILSYTFENSALKPTADAIDETLLCTEDTGHVFRMEPISRLQYRETKTVEMGFEANAHTHFNMYAWLEGDANNMDECPEEFEKQEIDIYMPGDPNEMHGYEAESGSTYIREGIEDVYYRIEFENDPEIANAAAHHIVITDNLDKTKLDLESFAPTSVMFGSYSLLLDGTEQSFVKTVDMRPAINALARVELQFNSTTGTAVWDITSIDPMTMEETDDAMQGILAVGGMGEVTFDIKLKEGLANGTAISNMATIVFDQEGAINTPVFTNIIDLDKPVSEVVSYQQISGDKAKLTIESADEGSGLWRYDIYIQPGENAEWVKVAENVENTENAEPFCVEVNANSLVDNGFCVIATDAAGNVEQKTLQREGIAALMLGDTNEDGVVDILDYVNYGH